MHYLHFFLFSLFFFLWGDLVGHVSMLFSYHIVIYIRAGFLFGFVRCLLDSLYVLLGLILGGVGFALCLAGSIWIAYGLEGLLLSATDKKPHYYNQSYIAWKLKKVNKFRQKSSTHIIQHKCDTQQLLNNNNITPTLTEPSLWLMSNFDCSISYFNTPRSKISFRVNNSDHLILPIKTRSKSSQSLGLSLQALLKNHKRLS